MDDIFKALEKVYGKRSSSGFGSSVFYEISNQEASLASITRDVYKLFMGEKWNPETEATWLSGSKIIYERSPGTAPDIMTKLNNIKDADAKRSVPLLTEFIQNAEQGKAALAAAFNHPDLSHFAVFKIGDNAEMSGLILSGLFADHSNCSVICLMD